MDRYVSVINGSHCDNEHEMLKPYIRKLHNLVSASTKSCKGDLVGEFAWTSVETRLPVFCLPKLSSRAATAEAEIRLMNIGGIEATPKDETRLMNVGGKEVLVCLDSSKDETVLINIGGKEEKPGDETRLMNIGAKDPPELEDETRLMNIGGKEVLVCLDTTKPKDET
ncbi:uncharacterized protein LOC130735913 [Lotus japonicus]|uniref:uncharacterized protein LOC130735913 n=1 Tax=Lotus japonicus TaxID=34305 RepID=UPI00258F584A|nr:uncharacterized protein LOC130735913 [Lotus japonicus]